jgi:polyisoprenoid-binding protein YceI
VTAPITLTGEIGGPSKDPWGNEKVSASLSTKISRKQWGLTGTSPWRRVVCS